MNREQQESIELTRELARVAKEHDLVEVEYENETVKLRLVMEQERPPANEQIPMGIPMMVPNIGPPQGTPTPAKATVTNEVSSGQDATEITGETLDSPLAGVFYRSSQPGAAPFVEEGQTVGKNTTLCIVEAMKLMNEITSERPCKIVKILVANEEAVEEGQPLFIIE